MSEINRESTTTFNCAAGADNFIADLGYKPLLIRKMYGPLIFCDLRIRADAETCEWVIERDCGNEPAIKNFNVVIGRIVEVDGPTIWKEWCRIPGQMEGDSGEEL